jgi:hypothetical protein
MSDIGNMPDSEFLAMYTSMIATISGDLASYPGLTAAMMTASGALRDDIEDKLGDHDTKQDASRAARIAKDDARALGEADVRKLRALMKANGVTDEKYTATGIPKPSLPTPPSNATVPVATVDTSERLRHTIHFAESAAPNIKRRPRDVVGVEIWRKLDGPPPTDESECTFVALDTATPYMVEYTGDAAGKTAHYMLRWQFRDGSRSAWGETVSATITG